MKFYDHVSYHVIVHVTLSIFMQIRVEHIYNSNTFNRVIEKFYNESKVRVSSVS